MVAGGGVGLPAATITRVSRYIKDHPGPSPVSVRRTGEQPPVIQPSHAGQPLVAWAHKNPGIAPVSVPIKPRSSAWVDR